MDFRFITADEREALYNEVWAEPVTTVAKRYGMSVGKAGFFSLILEYGQNGDIYEY
ncbi:MAG TPA: hypothetical protein GXZ25_03320 [Peptococcaceae bacterium]|jgi:hypothetical protein|nr:hypothetical protein [Peptococcaceae bacterium]